MNFSVRQAELKGTALLVFLVIIWLLSPFTTNFYMPALPDISRDLHTNAFMVNFTLSSYFACFTFGILFSGAFCDSYGRRRVLFLSLLLYITGSLICARCVNIESLIVGRVVQSLGAGALISVGTVTVKDRYEADQRRKIFSILQACIAIAPVLAPSLGSLLLSVMGWRSIFWILALVASLCLLCALSYRDPLDLKLESGAHVSLLSMIKILRVKEIALWLCIMSLISLPFMSYIALSAEIYMQYFHLSPQVYSFFFALSAIFAIAGSLSYARLSKTYRNHSLILLYLGLALGAGCFLWFFGSSSAFASCAGISVMAIGFTGMRPLIVNTMLAKYPWQAGSISGLTNAFHTLFSSAGMLCASSLLLLPFFEGNPLKVVASMLIVFISFMFFAYYSMVRRGYHFMAEPIVYSDKLCYKA